MPFEIKARILTPNLSSTETEFMQHTAQYPQVTYIIHN